MRIPPHIIALFLHDERRRTHLHVLRRYTIFMPLTLRMFREKPAKRSIPPNSPPFGQPQRGKRLRRRRSALWGCCSWCSARGALASGCGREGVRGRRALRSVAEVPTAAGAAEPRPPAPAGGSFVKLTFRMLLAELIELRKYPEAVKLLLVTVFGNNGGGVMITLISTYAYEQLPEQAQD